MIYVYFFFFQAEDGIRDYKVTGVQTCALPICPPAPYRAVPKQRARVLGPRDNAGRGGEAADGDRNGGAGEGPVAVAELPELVPPRALRRPVGKTHTAKERAG